MRGTTTIIHCNAHTHICCLNKLPPTCFWVGVSQPTNHSQAHLPTYTYILIKYHGSALLFVVFARIFPRIHFVENINVCFDFVHFLINKIHFDVRRYVYRIVEEYKENVFFSFLLWFVSTCHYWFCFDICQISFVFFSQYL